MEIVRKDTVSGRLLEVEITASHTVGLPSQTNIWSQISKHSFQNIYVHCNVSEPVYVGSDMAQVMFTHGVNTERRTTIEDVHIPHLIFYRLSQFDFRELHLELRDNTGNRIPFQGDSTVTASHPVLSATRITLRK